MRLKGFIISTTNNQQLIIQCMCIIIINITIKNNN